MNYNFKGVITSFKDYKIPFDVQDGRIRLNVSNVSSKDIYPIDSYGREYFTSVPAFNQEYIEGETENGEIIKIHVHSYYEGEYNFVEQISNIHFIYGNISSCIILNKERYNGVIDKIGFYSVNINKITGHIVSGSFNEEHFGLFGKDRTIATYKENGNSYFVNYDFIEKKYYCSGQIISVESDKQFSQEMVEDVFWTMRKLLAFVYQRKEIPLSDVFLFEKDVLVGQVFVQKFTDDKECLFGIKCLQIGFWREKLSNLLQALVDRKIYLRHLPEYSDDKHKYTPSRYLSTVVGLESTLNILGIQAHYSKKHIEAINAVKCQLEKLINATKGKEKKEYKGLLNSMNDERFADKVLAAIKDNCDYINNFFVLDRLGADINKIAEDISKSRNHFAHGYLEEDLGLKHAEQCDFMDLFILYLQLLYVGFDKKEASRTVPLVIFNH